MRPHLLGAPARGRALIERNVRAAHVIKASDERLLTTAGVAEARLHDARHTTATILTALGIDPTAVQTLLGHSSLLVTQGYQHVTAEMLAPAMNALHKAFKANADQPGKSSNKRGRAHA